MELNLDEALTDKCLDLLQSLRYSSYKFNRTNAPGITPDEWGLVYGPEAYVYEKLYQMENK